MTLFLLALLALADPTFSAPARVAELDMGKLKGEPTRLAWSPDGKQVYIQTTENAGKPNAKPRHYLFSLENGSKEDVSAEPAWAAAYWTEKSAQASPDDRTFRIEAKSEQRSQRTTSAPMGGEMARGGTSGDPSTGASSGDAIGAAYGAQSVTVNMMVLKGETIGEFVNSVLVPGLTFGWAPKGTKLIAYAAPKDGQVIVMDSQGKKQEIPGTKAAILPAWSADATRIAWLQRDGRKKYTLQVSDVTK